jgi:hypothetical protein
MKKIILTLSIFFFTLLSFSQGIAIQGIARDANNTARINANIALIFEIYYLNESNTPQPIYSETPTLLTDSFGVFSHVLNMPNETESQFSNQELYLKISEGTTPISDELFKRVPLAYSASNGVPTGSIMPFIGATAPTGWILCDGGAIPINSNTAALRALLGSVNSPDLQGMFLRGTGTNSDNQKAGPALNTTQTDSNKEHLHAKGTLATNSTGEHSHTLRLSKWYRSFEGANGDENPYIDEESGSTTQDDLNTSSVGNHGHTISGSTAKSGGTESRPVNYGVNYIIKL